MDEAWRLPTTIEIGGAEYEIRTDFRAILDILKAQSDPELTGQEKAQVMFEILYLHPEQIPYEYAEEALQKGIEFIDCGITDDGRKKPRLMDWEQDVPIIAPAVNKLIGKDVRSIRYLHWWTFLGAYMEIGEGLFSAVISIRQKKAKGKKLDKAEMEFYRDNRKLVDLKLKTAERPEEQKEALNELFGLKK